MRRIIEMLAALCLPIALTSCNDFPDKPETVTLQIDVGGEMSRCTYVEVAEESAVHDLQVFVFGRNGALEAYGRSSEAHLTLDCIPGSKDVWAVVNAPSLASVVKKDDLASSVSDLADNSAGRLVMAGHRNIEIDGDMQGYVPVQRLCAKVVLGKIVKAFTSDVLQGRRFVVKRIYLTNVAGQCSYGNAAEPETYTPMLDGLAPSVWYNKMGCNGDVGWLLCDSPDSHVNDVYHVRHTFYTYPNPCQTGARGGAWSPRTTRLVIETELDGNVGYYVIEVPGIEGNHAYVFDSVELHRPGSDSPETVSGEDTVRFGFCVVDWAEGSEYDEFM